MKVLSLGSLNIDYTYRVDHFVQKGETVASDSLQVFSGGKGLNQSIALAKAGAEVYHAGAIGEDGKFLLAVMEEAGVDTSCVKILDDVRTGNAIIQNEKRATIAFFCTAEPTRRSQKPRSTQCSSDLMPETALCFKMRLMNCHI